MSMFDKTTVCKTPCPDCDGKVYRDYFGGDCRGNPPETTFRCKGFCKRDFSEKEWKGISHRLNKKSDRKRRIVLAPSVEGSIPLKEVEKAIRQIEEDKKHKKLRKKYRVVKKDGKKFIIFSTRKNPYPSLADLLQAVAEEFKGVKKRDLLFSTDNENMYLGNDDLPEKK